MLFRKCPDCDKNMIELKKGGWICVSCGNIIEDVVVDCPEFLKDIFGFNK